MQSIGFAYDMDVDAKVAEVGADYDWTHDDELIAEIISWNHDLESYNGVYDMMSHLGFPWATDDYFSESIPLDFITIEDLAGWVSSAKFNDLPVWAEPSADWIPREDRFHEGFKEYFSTVDFGWNAYYRPSFEDMF